MLFFSTFICSLCIKSTQKILTQNLWFLYVSVSGNIYHGLSWKKGQLNVRFHTDRRQSKSSDCVNVPVSLAFGSIRLQTDDPAGNDCMVTAALLRR